MNKIDCNFKDPKKLNVECIYSLGKDCNKCILWASIRNHNELTELIKNYITNEDG